MLFRSDRKSTRLNSSHTIISYAVFCLKKKRKSICVSLICRGRPVSFTLACWPATELPAAQGCVEQCREVGEEARKSVVCFFFKETGAPEYPPSSPTHPFPD